MGTVEQDAVARRYPLRYVSSWMTLDGEQVTIRPIRSADEPLMVKFHQSLSDRTVYLRYFTSMSLASRTDHARLERICSSNYERQMVLVALHRDSGTGEMSIVGVGRLNKLEIKNEAETAIVVCDRFQQRELGTALLRTLIRFALDERLHRIVAEVLRDNVAVQSMFKSLGFRLRLLGDPSSVHAVLDL